MRSKCMERKRGDPCTMDMGFVSVSMLVHHKNLVVKMQSNHFTEDATFRIHASCVENPVDF